MGMVSINYGNGRKKTSLLFDQIKLTQTLDCFCSTGHISMGEFIEGAQQDPWVLNMLKLELNPAGWLLQQQRRAHF